MSFPVSVNGQTIEVTPDLEMLDKFLQWRRIPAAGTAVAINGKIIKKENWCITRLKVNDSLMIISGAYGG